jgi:hypothetical protein
VTKIPILCTSALSYSYNAISIPMTKLTTVASKRGNALKPVYCP